MSKSVAALAVIVLCALTVAACGGSDSSSSTTTATATVPSGKLGAAGSTAQCPPPVIPGYSISPFTAYGVPCDVARTAFASVIRDQRADGWKCNVSVARGITFTAGCADETDPNRKFTGRWTTLDH